MARSNFYGNSADPNHPGQIPEYWRDRVLEWELLEDVYNGLHSEDDRIKYLRQKQYETANDYKARVKESNFDNYFKDAIQGYSGLLSNYDLLEDTPEYVLENLDNINRQGDNLKTWLMDVDTQAIRDDCCLAIADTQPSDPENPHSERSPWLTLVDIRNVFSPLVKFIEGEWIVLRVVILRYDERSHGAFGSKTVKEWRVYTPGLVEVIEEDENGQLITAGDYQLHNARGEVLDRVPIEYYSVTGSRLLMPNPAPLLGLAELNLKHFQKESEVDETESKVNTITPWRQWPGNVPEKRAPLPSGPGKVIEIPGGEYPGKVGLMEAQGRGLALAHQRQQARVDRMRHLSQTFLTATHQKTATEAVLESSQSKLTLRAIASRKESFVQRCFHWLAVLGDPTYQNGDDVGGIKVSEKHLEAPMTADEKRQVREDWESGFISRELAYKLLHDRGAFPQDITFDEVLESTSDIEIDDTQVVNQVVNRGNENDDNEADRRE